MTKFLAFIELTIFVAIHFLFDMGVAIDLFVCWFMQKDIIDRKIYLW